MALKSRRAAGLIALFALLGACALLAGPSGCSPGPSVEDRARRTWAAFCDRARACAPSAFAAAFSDYPACIEKGVAGIAPDDRDRAASCSEAEAEACVATILDGPCPRLGDFSTGELPLDPRVLPSPCPRCSPLGPELRDAGAGSAP